MIDPPTRLDRVLDVASALVVAIVLVGTFLACGVILLGCRPTRVASVPSAPLPASYLWCFPGALDAEHGRELGMVCFATRASCQWADGCAVRWGHLASIGTVGECRLTAVGR